MDIRKPAVFLAAAAIGAASFPSAVKSQNFEGPRFSHNSRDCQFTDRASNVGVVVSLGKPLYVATQKADFESAGSGFKQVPTNKGASLPSDVAALVKGAEKDLLQRCADANSAIPVLMRETTLVIGSGVSGKRPGVYTIMVPTQK